jgi:hypothetical protein
LFACDRVGRPVNEISEFTGVGNTLVEVHQGVVLAVMDVQGDVRREKASQVPGPPFTPFVGQPPEHAHDTADDDLLLVVPLSLSHPIRDLWLQQVDSGNTVFIRVDVDDVVKPILREFADQLVDHSALGIEECEPGFIHIL